MFPSEVRQPWSEIANQGASVGPRQVGEIHALSEPGQDPGSGSQIFEPKANVALRTTAMPRIVSLLLLFAFTGAAQAQGKPEPLVAQVKTSISNGVRYLVGLQRP